MATIQPAITGNTYTREVVLGYAQRRRDVHTLSRLHVMGLWDFAWWVYQEVNFSPRITQITLIFYFFFA